MKPLGIKPVVLALGSFLSITFVLCVIGGLLVPSNLATMPQFLESVPPGFRWISVGSFFLGLVESFLYGVYSAVVFVPLYNYFSGAKQAPPESQVAKAYQAPEHVHP